jgi:hypothetical protein
VKIVTLALALVCSAACGRGAPPADPQGSAAATHQHHAPHDGVLVELGGEFAHVELVLDPGAGALTAYILDGEAEESIRLKQPSLTVTVDPADGAAPRKIETLELAARANILTGETVGDSSEFSVTDASLLHRTSIHGHLANVAVKGQVFHDVQF